jgi:hypothetical protein
VSETILIEALVADARPDVAAVNVHWVPEVMTTSLANVATPFTAPTVIGVPLNTQLDVMAIESLYPALLDVSTLPYVSSTETAKVGSAAPQAPSVVGNVVNTTLLGAPGLTANPNVVVAPVSPDASVAVSVHDVPAVSR